MKKFLIGILAMIILATLLSSCSNSSLGRKEFSTSEKPQETNTRVDEQTETVTSDTDNVATLEDTSDIESTTAYAENSESSEVTSAVEETTEIIVREVNFHQYLDDIHFVPGISQKDFEDQIGAYMYNGEKITANMVGMHYDGLYGGGLSMYSDILSACNDYTVTEDEKYAVYTNKLTTSVQLGGLDLPNSISFDYTLSMVLLSLDIDVDLEGDFADAEDAKIILRSDETSSLTLTDLSLSADDPGYSYQLAYEENYLTIRASGKEATVTRYVRMSFDKDDTTLCSLSIAVIETYARG